MLLALFRGLGYSGTMKLSNFLDKYHSRKDKILILEKMLKIATKNKTINAYYSFVKRYPKNPSVPKAWRNMATAKKSIEKPIKL